jgi:hypothetical protein
MEDILLKKARFLVFALVLVGCDIEKIGELINTTPKLNVSNESANPDGDVITPNHSVGFSGSGSGRKELFEENRKLTKTLEKYVAFDPNADTLFPGSLVQGKSLPDGVLSPIVTERTPLTITVTDLVSSDPNASYSKRVANPSLATITDAKQQILNQQLATNQPAKITYSETTMSSLEEGFLKLGASYRWLTGNVSGSFQLNTSNYSTSLMIRFVQSYYTVSAEPPSSPTSYISNKASFDSFQSYTGPGNPPTYVSSVTYGRELWMLIESNHEASEVKAALDAAFSAAASGGSINLSAGQKKVFDESSIQILILGGAGRPAVQVVVGDHVSALKDFLLAGASYSKSSPGVIISYVVRYLKDNDVARVSSATDYTIKTSAANPEAVGLRNMRVTWTTTGDDKDWNSQPVVDVYDRTGRHVGHVDCCSADRNGDHWTNGMVTSDDLQILIGGLTNADLSQGRFNARRNAVGNDDWDYTATIEFDWLDGSKSTYSCSGRNSCSTQW